MLGRRGITELNYRYAHDNEAHVFAGIQLSEGFAEKDELITKLRDKKYPVVDLTDNEMAKIHVRHLVGGHNQSVEDEIIYRFEFPERPGALLKFLRKLGKSFNISLFHYRNHGAAYGRVLVGLQITADEREQLQGYLEELGYRYWDETDNTVYQRFLR